MIDAVTYVRVRCDHPGCGATIDLPAPHGFGAVVRDRCHEAALRKGWEVAADNLAFHHFCPEHAALGPGKAT